ncbi:hypothetical protein [Caballeronia grimmiae]|uniref:hypothetical protein n=1 Tax=Caballeronia grimmiae TaxID=1071679 RepID=UPI0038B8D3D3
MDNDKLPENDPLHGIWDRIPPEHQKWFSANRQNALKDIQEMRADHRAHRDERIAAKEEFLTKHYQLKNDMEKSGPRTRAQIQQEARGQVDGNYKARVLDRAKKGRDDEHDYLRDVVGIERRGPHDRDRNHGIDRT